MDTHTPGVAIRAWKPPVPGIREVLHARFAEHAYPPHTHDTWTLFVVDDGAIRYDLDRRDHGADPHGVSLLPPHVVHDGRPGRVGGYRKRVIYLEAEAIGEALIGPIVDRPASPDPSLRQEVSGLLDALECADDAFEAELRLAAVLEELRASYGAVEAPAPDPTPDMADAFRAYLDAHVFDAVTAADAAATLDASPTRLARSFAAAFHITPHAYLLGRRLDAARDRILDGEPLASVAAGVGFFDQAHLTRRFQRYLGTTPGRYARSAIGPSS